MVVFIAQMKGSLRFVWFWGIISHLAEAGGKKGSSTFRCSHSPGAGASSRCVAGQARSAFFLNSRIQQQVQPNRCLPRHFAGEKPSPSPGEAVICFYLPLVSDVQKRRVPSEELTRTPVSFTPPGPERHLATLRFAF